MRICRIFKTFPNDATPGAGLHPYKLSCLIPEPCLVLTKAQREPLAETPPHVKVIPIAYSDVPFSEALEENYYHQKNSSFATSAKATRLLISKLREVPFYFQAYHHLSAFSPDIVHAHSPLFAPIAALAKALMGASFALSFHNAFEIDQLRQFPLLRRLCRFADLTFAVSEPMVATLRELNPTVPCIFSPSGVDTQEFCTMGLKRENTIISIGRHVWQKRHSDLLFALSHLREIGLRPNLLLIGDGPGLQAFEEQAATLGVSANVTAIRALDRHGIARELSKARVFALASSYEGMPKVVLEAAACGTPIVASDACNVPFVNRSAGAVVPVGKPKEIANAIAKLLTDEDEWRFCSEGARRIACDYSWEKIASIVQQEYHSLLNCKIGGPK